MTIVGSAAGHGAALAVVAEERLAGLGRMTIPLVVVSDVLKALEALGRAARARSNARIAAVTGSVGKTTTKEMLARALAPGGETHYSPASFNNHWGVPLTLARMPAEARYAVFEIGMNHAGEIVPLVAQVRPHVAIITTVEPVHIEYFPDGIAGIAAAKAEIFTGVEPGGSAILNRDNPFYRGAGAEGDRGRHRADRSASARTPTLRRVSSRPNSPPTIRASSSAFSGREIDFVIGAPGRHIVQNALAVLLAVGRARRRISKPPRPPLPIFRPRRAGDRGTGSAMSGMAARC